MDESLDNLESADADLEKQLLAAPLRRPSALLDARVRQTLRRGRTRAWKQRLAWGLAAMFVIASSTVLTHYLYRNTRLPPRTTREPTELVVAPVAPPESRPVPPLAASTPGPPAARPVRIVRTLTTVADDGVVATIHGCPIQRLRQLEVDQVVVFDPTRGCSVVYRRPREHTVFVAARAF